MFTKKKRIKVSQAKFVPVLTGLKSFVRVQRLDNVLRIEQYKPRIVGGLFIYVYTTYIAIYAFTLCGHSITLTSR